MACGQRPSNEVLLQQLRDGTAEFELLAPPNSPASNSLRFFARISSSLGGSSPAMKKVEHHSIRKVTGDGRCMFRALDPIKIYGINFILRVTSCATICFILVQVKGMANNKGLALSLAQERDDADELRMAVKEIICDSEDAERLQYEEALIAITVEESLKRYCKRIQRSDFWGGESELLVLSKLCHQPIIVYIPEHEHTMGRWGNGFIPIAEYGSEFGKKSRKGKQRMPVRLLYSGKNHYDLLV